MGIISALAMILGGVASIAAGVNMLDGNNSKGNNSK